MGFFDFLRRRKQRAPRQSRRNSLAQLTDLTQRIRPSADWKDLTLAAEGHQTLRQITAQVRARPVSSSGIRVLLAGGSAKERTLAAEVLASDLQLDLYRIDLSTVVTKWIGETEKNLRRIFDAADAGSAILFFDEADALFGKRTEVKDAHDRYANIEVSYLMQRVEAYQGLVVLATNLKADLDEAYVRRLEYVVEFAQRESAGAE